MSAELAQRPLMLSIFTLAYQGVVVEDLPKGGTRETQQRQVFAAYIERMLHRGAQSRYSQEHIQHWLAWLAQQMQQHNMTEFYLEQLQPTWLPTKRLQRFYASLTILVITLIEELAWLPMALLLRQFFLLLFGLLFPLALFQLIKRRQIILPVLSKRHFLEHLKLSGIRHVEVLAWSWKSFWLRLVFVGLVFGLVVGLVFGLVVGLVAQDSLTGVIVGVIAGVIGGLIFGSFLGLVMGPSIWLARRRTVAWISRLNRELLNSQINKDQRRKPNQNIRLSGWHGLCSGLVAVPASGLLLGLIFGLIGLFSGQGLGPWLLLGLPLGLFLGLLTGIDQGGLAYMQHYILRFLLFRTGAMPWHYVRFLDYAVERMLLREVGGGYIFIHRLLLDYFASLEKKES